MSELYVSDARPLARALAPSSSGPQPHFANLVRQDPRMIENAPRSCTARRDERPISARIAENAPRSSRLVDEALIRTAAAAGRRVAAAYESADRRDHRPIRLHVGLNSALDTS